MLDSIGRHETPLTGPTAVAHAVATGTTGRWLRAVSRVGLVSRAAVYLLVGYLTLRLVLATHPRAAEPASSTGAVQQAAQGSWGKASLLLLAAGFAAYALTQLVEALFRPRHADSPIKRWRQRVISTWGCLLYTAFCICTISLLVATRRPAGTARSEQRQDTAITAAVLRIGPGRLLLLVAGLLVVLAGAELGRRSIRLTFQERFTSPLRPPLLGSAARALGAFGCLARATVVILIGAFILKAAVLGDSRQIKGLDATFRSVARSTYGQITLSALALGLFSYGLYCLLEARYRDLTPGR
ncbi:MAG: hypothetical protein DLM58_18860 [Pseudonocardiales bacterium]|nr:MAG: hypothetical protein DLM58_18860 [Pseudonocardiales bacterium]